MIYYAKREDSSLIASTRTAHREGNRSRKLVLVIETISTAPAEIKILLESRIKDKL